MTQFGYVFSKRYGRKKHPGYVSKRRTSRICAELVRKLARAKRARQMALDARARAADGDEGPRQ